MTEEELAVVELRDGFYRDSFGKVLFVIVGFAAAILLLIALSLYIYLNRPPPLTFVVDADWRVQPPVPVNQKYLSDPDLLQWVADALPRAFNFDFIHYNDQLKDASQYFTESGWKIFLNQLNIYANYNTVQTNKLFIHGVPESAPFKLRDGLLQDSGRYGWWVQMQVSINYAGYQPPPNKIITLQVLVVRVPTNDNLSGVKIDNVVVIS